MSAVFIKRCERYEVEPIAAAIEEGLARIGFDVAGLDGRRVGLKPNLLRSLAPETAVITHPELFRAAARVVTRNGGSPVLVESPAVESLGKVLRRTGYAAVVDEEDIEVAGDEVVTLRYPQGAVFKQLEVLEALRSVDVLINLPKFKTHDYTVLSGAVKNLFGTVPGIRKATWHARASNPEVFPESIVDLYGALLQCLAPRTTFLHVMDGILAMDGNGPGVSGNPRPLGALIISDDGLALDCVQAWIAGLDPGEVPITRRGLARGLGSRPGSAQLVGDPIAELMVDDFEPPSSSISMAVRLEQAILFSSFFKRHFLDRPTTLEARCSGCFQCQQICASEAIQRQGTTARVLYDRCIRCYCCIEICPEAAMELRPGRFQAVLDVIQRLSG
jgi:uncharacterized protein (DUF362 family)